MATPTSELRESLRHLSRELDVFLAQRRLIRPRGRAQSAEDELATVNWARETLERYHAEFGVRALELFDETHRYGVGDRSLRAFIAHPVPRRARSARREIDAADALDRIVPAFEEMARALPDESQSFLRRTRAWLAPTVTARLARAWFNRLSPWIQTTAAVIAIGGLVIAVVSYLVRSCGRPGSLVEGTTLVVDNRVTSGPTNMREDRHAAYLSTAPRIYCKDRGCAIPGTDRHSGDTFAHAVCQTLGERTTNGEDDNPIDDKNPGLFSSNRYYGIRLTNNKLGYISEVWIRASQRGGLDLPLCK